MKKEEKQKRHQSSLYQQVKEEAMIILGKRLYKNHLNHKESSRYVFTKVQVPLEQEYNLYNIKNLSFIKKRRKKINRK